MRRAVVLAVLVAAALASEAGAAPPKQCDPVAFKGKGYTVIAHGVKCKFARTWVKRYLKEKERPKRWTCYPPSSGTNVRVNCQGPTKPQNDPAYRYYYGILQ